MDPKPAVNTDLSAKLKLDRTRLLGFRNTQTGSEASADMRLSAETLFTKQGIEGPGPA